VVDFDKGFLDNVPGFFLISGDLQGKGKNRGGVSFNKDFESFIRSLGH
jgi:hypothetical protein